MRSYLSIILLFIVSYINAQKQAEYLAGELLLQFESSSAAKKWIATKNIPEQQLIEIEADWGLYRLQFDPLKNNETQIIEALQQDKSIIALQRNHILRSRSLPDDPKYAQWQWNMELLNLPEAWQLTTGGLSATGDSIVVAVIDGGCDLQHEDIANNIWCNRNEIPDDSIDNDGNGYVDDYRAWQFVNENDVHEANSHGTSVAGIIGAVGNNGIGISGINWNLKLMIISAAEQDLLLESNIIKAYRYILEQRRLYRLTNGQKGAFVVAVNLSAGVDYGKAADFPLWCAIYDSLGQEGVLSVGAVMNNDINVDVEGDMPTTCASPFLITVTNTTRYDALHLNAAFGKQHVDLGAPGAVYTLRPNNTYNVFGGTSGAAPHVSGAIALLSAYPDTEWATYLKNEPMLAALQLRNILLLGVDEIAALDGKSSSGGRLNIGNAMQRLQKQQTIPSAALSVDFWGNNQLLLRFNIAEAGDYVFDIFDITGRLRHREKLVALQADAYSRFVNWDFVHSELLFARLSKANGQRIGLVKLLR